MRIQSQWFNADATKTPQQIAGAMAFITWRVTQNMLKQMRSADFDIDIGQPYFAFTRETLAFLAHVIDRMAYDRLSSEERGAFMPALVLKLGEILSENEEIYLGPRAPDEIGYVDEFVDNFNSVGAIYADYGCEEGEPDHGFVRVFGRRIEDLMPKKDAPWVIDQLMSIEVPEAAETLRRGMQGVLSKEPRKPRRSAAAAGD